MTNDLFFVLGIIISIFAFPSFVGAFSESRPPRTAAILAIIGGGMIVFAVNQQPSGYTLAGVPDVFARVIAHYFR